MKQNITVVSLGPGDPELLTAQSMNAMKKAKRLIFRTAQHPVYAALTEAGVQSTRRHCGRKRSITRLSLPCWMPEQMARCGSFGHSSRRTRSCAFCRA